MISRDNEFVYGIEHIAVAKLLKFDKLFLNYRKKLCCRQLYIPV